MDGTTLLGQQLDILGDFLNEADSRMSESSLMMLGTLKPLPPPQAIPLLLRFAERTDADAQRQARALTTAVIQNNMALRLKQSSQEEEIILAVERFALRNLDSPTRSALLDGIGLAGSTDRNPRLTAIVVAGLRHSDANVRKRGLHNLMRLGQEEIRKASVDVERLRTQDPDAEVRAEADKALRVMGGESQFPR